MAEETKVFYYEDAQNDEFSGVTKPPYEVPVDYPYLHKNPLWRICAHIVYRWIMTPIAFFHCKLRFDYKVVNRGALKAAKRQGYFMYANHTLLAGDAYLPTLVNFPKRVYVVVNAENIATPGTRNFIQMSGAIPIPSRFSGMKSFLNAIEKRLLQQACIQVYPEAHIWPFYTGIRPFRSVSFRYPVKFGAPVYSATTTFRKRKNRKTPGVTVYVDGPFYPDTALKPKQQEEKLRQEVYETMRGRTENNSYEHIRYEKKGEQQN